VIRGFIIEQAMQLGLRAIVAGHQAEHAAEGSQQNVLHKRRRAVFDEIGPNPPRVYRECRYPGSLETLGEVAGVDHHGQLRLVVGKYPVVSALGKVEVVEVKLGRLAPHSGVGGAGHEHDAARRARLQLVEEQFGQQEVGEVVHTELRLYAVFSLALGRVHHAGVVDEAIEAVVFGFERHHESPNGREAVEVELHYLS
jgi:hypothetical protein